MDFDLLEYLKGVQKRAFASRSLTVLLTVDVLDAIIERLDDSFEYTTARQSSDGEIWDVADFAWSPDRREAASNLKHWYDSGYDEPDEDPVVLVKRRRSQEASEPEVDHGA